jgi:hypothetical protein
MHPFRLFSVAALAALALAAGCGGSDEKYYIPADHQIRPFAEPEEDELAGDEEEVLEDEGAAEPEAAPAAEPAAEPAAAPAPAAVPEKKPAKPGKKAGKAAKAKPASAKSE